MQRFIWICAGVALAGLSSLVAAQAWPSEPIRYIVPFAAGGSTDILGRVVAEKLSAALGQPVVVENKPGAGGGVGVAEVAKAAPDGYTIIGGTISTHAINATLYSNLPYDPAKDFVAITMIARAFDNITTAWPLAKGGKLRALAVTTAKRSSVAPDVPTLAESGLPGYEVGSWQGVFGPAGMSPEIVTRLNTEIVKILNMPDVQKKIVDLGAEPVANSSEEFAAFVKAEGVKWGDVVKKSGAKVD